MVRKEQQDCRDIADDVAVGRGLESRRHYLAPWYLAYLILGLITSGMLLLLVPLRPSLYRKPP